MKIFFTFFFLFTSLISFGENNCDSNDFEQLKNGCREKTISLKDFSKYLKTIKKLENIKCFDYVQVKDGQEYVETGLTFLFGQICILTNNEIAVKEYINYLKRHSGSAEEQRSFSFEKIFVQNPTRTLSLINYDTELLNHIVWGFINNRLYGVKDPYKSDPNKAYTVYYKELKIVLNSKNYSNVFYKVNPTLKTNYLKYKKQIDYLLVTIKDGLEERGK